MITATILIPDISGYTEFLTQTEIKHSSHIINELLEGIIASNRLGFHLSEVEGDAILFYKKGAAIPRAELVEQCIEMYRRFHQQLMIIERDSICRCGACSKASSLTLKFVAHFGEIQEIKVSNFLKATGADMIVAHRLLKNGIEKHEYLLLSKSLTAFNGNVALLWMSGQEEYASIGKVDFEYAYLDAFRRNLTIPPPSVKEAPPEPLATAKTIFIDIDASATEVYQNLIDTDKRSIWVKGMTKLEHQAITERAGMAHFCLTNGLGLDHTIVSSTFDDEEINYIEKVEISRFKLTVWDYYRVENLGEQRSRLSLRFAFRRPNFITRILERIVLKNISKDFILFKKMCETSF